MTFDKTKAMRSAEKFLSQGKIGQAIGEYSHVVSNDPADYSTMNILGDLYVKDADEKSAINCYLPVADHYGKQGFIQKAIAVYNKITKLDPNKIEIAEKLAELYKAKGSTKEAITHYRALAEHYEKTSKSQEALEIWKEISKLDTSNKEICIQIATSYKKQGQTEEAALEYAEAGRRFFEADDQENAVSVYEKALDLKEDDLNILNGYVAAKIAVGRPSDAIERLREILEKQPYNREVQLILIDCLVQSNDVAEAEAAVIRLVEQEPANYPKFLILAKLYSDRGDLESATRILSMSSEYMLVGGQAEDFRILLDSVLEQDNTHLTALRLKVRYSTWERDENSLKTSLIDLANAAKEQNVPDEERFALIQLTKIASHEVEFQERLVELSTEQGYEMDNNESDPFYEHMLKNGYRDSSSNFEAFLGSGPDDTNDAGVMVAENGFGDYNMELAANGSGVKVEPESFNSNPGFAFTTPDGESFEAVSDFEIESSNGNGHVVEEVSTDNGAESGVERELDSIKFYIDNGYFELAEKALSELSEKYGEMESIAKMKQYSDAVASSGESDVSFDPQPELVEEVDVAEAFEIAEEPEVTVQTDEAAPVPVEVTEVSKESTRSVFDMDDFRDSIGIDEINDAESDSSDYETHYHTAVAYQEMGLTEQAIKEFQEAVSQVKPNDGSRRFFQCATMLGHCFMQNSMANLSVMWFKRALETNDLLPEEKQGVWYEVAESYEAEGDLENASAYFHKVYAENANFREVGFKVKSLTLEHK